MTYRAVVIAGASLFTSFLGLRWWGETTGGPGTTMFSEASDQSPKTTGPNSWNLCLINAAGLSGDEMAFIESDLDDWFGWWTNVNIRQGGCSGSRNLNVRLVAANGLPDAKGCPREAAGCAAIGSWKGGSTAYVVPDRSDLNTIGDAVAHEAGHAAGLGHDMFRGNMLPNVGGNDRGWTGANIATLTETFSS
jgi:hypothetical protein